MKNPDEIFELCKKTSKIFSLDYKQEHLDSFIMEERDAANEYAETELSKNYFIKKFEESLSFTSLLFCCSIIYTNRIKIENTVTDPLNDKFNQKIIELILKEANQLNSYRMNLQISEYSGFDIDYYEIEYTFEYQCMRYLSLAANNIYKGFDPTLENQYFKNLAYNFYFKPGLIKYFYYSNVDEIYPPILKLEDKDILKILYDNIEIASSFIVPKL